MSLFKKFKKPANPLKHRVYIVSFSFLGWLLAYTLFSFAEYLTIAALIDDFTKNSLGLSWAQWWLVHYLALLLSSLVGLVYGFWQGNYWWGVVYEKRKK